MQLTITRPDDWHLHVRDGAVLADVVPHTARQFARAIIMPNLRPPVTTTSQALAYRERILAAVPEDHNFAPLMTLYLTDTTSPEEIRRAKQSGHVHAVKLYPAGATTHSDAGVTDISKTYPVLEALQETGLPLLVHGETTDPDVDVFDREEVFIEDELVPIVQHFPKLRMVLEHITTADGIAFVQEAGKQVAGTLSAHHLLLNRNAMFAGGFRPHHYCLPVLKRESHRLTLIDAATSGNPAFFLGSDSAPHPRSAKEATCGCAGIYTAHAALELYATAFEDAGALDRLEAFASFYGPDFYGLPRNTDQITLTREEWTVPETYRLGDDAVVPLCAGETLRWRFTPPA
jgi:dihydroorotase